MKAPKAFRRLSVGAEVVLDGRVCGSSESPRYGGRGTPPVETEDNGWLIPAETAVVLCPRALEAEDDAAE